MPTMSDKAMIQDPNKWPAWPFLPLKKGSYPSIEDKRLGVLYHSPTWSDGKVHVIHCYLFAPPKTREELHATPSTVYESVDALLADGWVVD